MKHTTSVGAGTFAERLREIRPPVFAPLRQALLSLLDAEAQQVGHTRRDATHRAYLDAMGREQCARTTVERAQDALRAAEAFLTRQTRHWILAAVVALFLMSCWAVETAADYILNRAVIPWLLSVPPQSWLGISLSIAPAVAPLVLDRVVVMLLEKDTAWGTPLAPATPDHEPSTMRRIVRVGFFFAVGALTILTAFVLANSRGIASAIKNHRLVAPTAAQQSTIDGALQYLALAVTVNSALFFLFGMHELRASAAARSAQHEVRRRRAELERALERHAESDSDRRAKEQAWNSVREIEEAAVAVHVADGIAALESVIAGQTPAYPAEQLVAERLVRRAVTNRLTSA